LDFLRNDAKEEPRPSASVDAKPQLECVQRFLLGNTEKLARTAKAQRIYDGLLPNFSACWSLVEFRPVFDASRTEIENGIIVGTFIIKTRSHTGDPKEDFTFQ